MLQDFSTFDFNSTASQVVEGIDLTGRSCVVTGAASGIGTETARALASAGADVTIATRNLVAAQAVARNVGDRTAGRVRAAELDLASPASISAFTAAWTGPLHVLVCNAGVMAVPELRLTEANWEMHFATNHLGHFQLATELHPSLSAAKDARVVSVTSRGHLRSPVDFDDPNFAHRDYDPYIAYGQSKTANILFAVGLTARWRQDGIVGNAVHPGAIEDTNLSRFIPEEHMKAFRDNSIYKWKTLEQGAATSTYVAARPELAGIGGRYFEDCHEAEVLSEGSDFTATGVGVAPWAVDAANASQLWELSERLVAVAKDERT
jgi:NAD(P)-dependent dehydrogenase (short-subunit alcohol dehydrogenase family)